jgi:hypothetical protein
LGKAASQPSTADPKQAVVRQSTSGLRDGEGEFLAGLMGGQSTNQVWSKSPYLLAAKF